MFGAMIASACIFSTLLPSALATAACYYPDGTNMNSYDYMPCNAMVGVSGPCCALNRTSAPGQNVWPEYAQDICLQNGLCENFANIADGNVAYTYWRVGCSSAIGTGCLDICQTQAGSGSTIQLTPCDSTSATTKWCCGANNTACCSTWPNGADAVTIPLGIKAVTATASSSITSASGIVTSSTASTTGTSSSGPSGTSLPNANNSSNASSGLTTGAKAGIAIAAIAGAAILLAAGYFVARIQQKKGSTNNGSDVRSTSERVGPVAELDHQRQAHELSGQKETIHELQWSRT